MTVRLDDTNGRRVEVLGLGIDTVALLPHLGRAERVRAWVDEPDQITESAERAATAVGASVGLVSDLLAGIEQLAADSVIVRSPGFPRYRIDLDPLYRRFSTTTPLALWLDTHSDRIVSIVVTGTKGKSTVTTMLAALLPDSLAIGNIGTPAWTVPEPGAGTLVICEMSSYQAADTDSIADLAVLTNLSEDHVSWHGSVDRYHRDKLRPVLAARRVLVDASAGAHLAGAKGVVEIHTTSTEPDMLDGLAPHMRANAHLALAAAEWVAADFGRPIAPDPMQVLLNLPPLRGRLRRVPSDDAHEWYDDALASNPSGAAAAVRAFAGRPIWLIVGGVDRNVSLGPLVDALLAGGGPLSVIALPDSGQSIAERLAAEGVGVDRVIPVPDVAAAVAAVREHADQPAVVLFSPAAPTPPQHGNWSNRSDAFESAVREHASMGDAWMER